MYAYGIHWPSIAEDSKILARRVALELLRREIAALEQAA